jgi:hypothetical protein
LPECIDPYEENPSLPECEEEKVALVGDVEEDVEDEVGDEGNGDEGNGDSDNEVGNDEDESGGGR